ncbi:hypothetical protein ACFPA8_25310 [Streptomyces ovatisporus]|uniref:Small hydrophilic protein n=1 Tax=Streptomyces ovatisporus TaxID=1128682 RepID=A0ABV9AC32_9ACTN
MTKGRNQDRSQRKAEAVDRDQSASQDGAAEGRQQRPSSGRTASPADVARKHQRRFGHN